MKMKLIALMSVLMLPIAYSAQTITYNLNDVSVGTIFPVSNSPWGNVTITEVSPNSVTLNFGADLTKGEFYSSLGLNLKDDFVYSPTITLTSISTSGNFNLPKISIGNNVKSGGAGVKYDIWFDFDTSNSQGGVKRFDESDSVTYRINGIGIEAFKVESNKVIAHAQNLTGGASSWIGTCNIPEPSAIMLGGFGLLFLLTNRRRA